MAVETLECDKCSFFLKSQLLFVYLIDYLIVESMITILFNITIRSKEWEPSYLIYSIKVVYKTVIP